MYDKCEPECELYYHHHVRLSVAMTIQYSELLKFAFPLLIFFYFLLLFAFSYFPIETFRRIVNLSLVLNVKVRSQFHEHSVFDVASEEALVSDKSQCRA